MNSFTFGKSTISEDGPCYVIAEIGNNHQGSLETALQMIKVAAGAGADAVKFQKRDNKALYTKDFYNKPYDNENSYGATYGIHRDYLEFGMEEYVQLKKCAAQYNVDFLATAFDFPSVDFLEELGVGAYKVASGDLTSLPLLKYIAKLGKPMFVSTGAGNLDEVRLAYDAILQHNSQLCLLHCTAGYPTEYHDLNLRVIDVFKKEFPKAIIGYSGHDNGILAASIAYMLGARVVEKHFTLNRAWQGTDHKFSLEPEGLRKQVRDLQRINIALGTGVKELQDFEKGARAKMGKGVYLAKPLSAGTTLTMEDLVFKSPANAIPPYKANEVIGKKLNVDLQEEASLDFKYLE